MHGSIRKIKPDDEEKLQALLSTRGFFHHHLDWHEPLDWLNSQPFLVLEDEHGIQGFISCPEEPDGVIWVHGFYSRDSIYIRRVWQELLDNVIRFPALSRNAIIATIPLDPNYENALIQTGFSTCQSIVNLVKEIGAKSGNCITDPFSIRDMNNMDIEAVAQVDRHAFPPLWQLQISSLQKALSTAFSAKVAYANGAIDGYQISTRHQRIVHLARIAVAPEKQRSGIATSLIFDLEERCRKERIQQITLNTQSDNLVSLRLYAKLGFIKTDVEYPVYIRNVH